MSSKFYNLSFKLLYQTREHWLSCATGFRFQCNYNLINFSENEILKLPGEEDPIMSSRRKKSVCCSCFDLIFRRDTQSGKTAQSIQGQM